MWATIDITPRASQPTHTLMRAHAYTISAGAGACNLPLRHDFPAGRDSPDSSVSSRHSINSNGSSSRTRSTGGIRRGNRLSNRGPLLVTFVVTEL